VVVWLLDIILFTAITATFFTRWIMFPKPTRAMFDNEIDQTTYVSTGTITIAAATLVELVALVPGAKWSNWEYVAYALWWATVLLALLGGSAVYWILIRDEEVHLSNLSPTLLYPVTGVLATASAGSVVVNYTDLSPKLAMPVIVVSYLLLGMGERTFAMTHDV
jgi:tellurite resistance protein TehA-like permease